MEGVTTWTMDIIVTGPNHSRHAVIVEKKNLNRLISFE